jgi:glycosyltransferase involved in cell wall biosynthesis
MSMRLLLLMSNFGDGGIERTILNYAHGLTAAGVACDLAIQAKARAERYLEQLPPQVRLIELNANRPAAVERQVATLLQATAVDALIPFRPRDYAPTLRARERANSMTKVILHTGLNLGLHLQELELLGLRRWKFLYRVHRYWAQADGALCITRGIAEDWRRHKVLPTERLPVVTNPVIGPEFDALAAQPTGHPWLEAKQFPVILGVGRLHSSKNFSLLLRAFALLRQKRPCRLIILGEGKERTLLEQLAQELNIAADVSLPGFHPNPYAWMRAADVFALSSRMEAFGFVLAEALAAGTPVVATDCPTGPREVLENGRYGSLVPPGDAHSMAESLLTALTAPSPAAQLRRAGQRHSVGQATDELIAAVTTLTSRKSR